MVIASHEQPEVVREEILGHLSRVIDKPGVEVGTHEAGDQVEFIVSVPSNGEHGDTLQQLKSLSDD